MDLNTIESVARPRRRIEFPKWQAGDAFLAGGTWLFSEPQPKLTRLVDLTGLGWEPLRAKPSGLEIAATCKIARLDSATLPVGWTAAPLINQCARAFLASFKIWNMATVGGNLCMSLPAGPMISLTAALDGTCTIWDAKGGERTVKVVDFVRGPLQNVLGPGDILRQIDLPVAALTQRTAFRQISLSKLGRSGALVIGTMAASGSFTLTITASTPKPFQFVFPKLPASGDLRARIERDLPLSGYFNDVHGKPAWRRHMTLHFAEEIRAELAGDPT